MTCAFFADAADKGSNPPTLKDYRGNIYRVKDRDIAASTIQACIIAHTFASRYDGEDQLRELLELSFSEEQVHDIVTSLHEARPSRQELRTTRQAAQPQHEEDTAQAAAGMSQHASSGMRSSQAHDLREEMFQALFRSTGREEEDTTPQSRRYEKTAEEHNSMMREATETGSQASSAARRRKRPRTTGASYASASGSASQAYESS